MQILSLIEGKIIEGEKLLSELSSMRETSGMAINVTYYVAEDVENAIYKINKWQLVVKDIIINGFGIHHRYVESFTKTITKKNTGLDFRREFEHEIKEGLSVLESICESFKLGLDDKKNTVDVESTGKKPAMVFISHSSKDLEFVEALVTLLEDIGFDNTNLFCSSVTGYGVELSQDIFETLLSLFNQYELFVIFIHSPRYYKSTVSLNEMGAAWVLKNDISSFLTTDMEFSDMTGVVDNSKISIKVNHSDAPARLTELKDRLISMFELKSIDNIKWERKRQAFLEKVLSIKYEENIFNDKQNENHINFDNIELQIFSKWANNPTDSSFMAIWTRQGLEVHFGYHNSCTFSRGEEEASYEDFMNRLQQAGYVIPTGRKDNVTYYKITKQGYDFAKTLLDK